MIDIYVDDICLGKIDQKHGQQILVFVNGAKDETLCIPVSDNELKNIYDRVRMRCETLGLIGITNAGRDAL